MVLRVKSQEQTHTHFLPLISVVGTGQLLLRMLSAAPRASFVEIVSREKKVNKHFSSITSPAVTLLPWDFIYCNNFELVSVTCNL